MRTLNIKGKHNIDELNKIDYPLYQSIRKRMMHFNEATVHPSKQLDIIRDLYLADGIKNIINAEAEEKKAEEKKAEAEEKDVLKKHFTSELLIKIQGYRCQDIKKEVHNLDTLITLEDVLEKLLISKLTCCYCRKSIMVFYKNVRDPQQWTLDRIDNDLNHTKDNTCISCLKCNLQRRIMDAKKFDFTKKLVIKKV
jgi:hypothetical protein